MYKVTFGKVDQFHFWCLLTSTLIEFFSYCFVFAECCLETIWFLEQTKRTDIFLMSWPKYGKLCFSPIDSDELRSLLSPCVSVIAFFDDYINPHSRQAYNWWPQVKQRLMLIKTETKREAKEHIASQSKHYQCMGFATWQKRILMDCPNRSLLKPFATDLYISFNSVLSHQFTLNWTKKII